MTPIQLGFNFTPPPTVTGRFGWFDDTKGRSTADKIVGGALAYREKHSELPTIVLCSLGDCGPLVEVGVEGVAVRVRAESYIRPNVFQFGRE